MKLVEVEATEGLGLGGTKARISYPILKDFLSSGMTVAKLVTDEDDVDRPVQNLYVALTVYIKSHQLPVAVSTRKGELFLGRKVLDGEEVTPLDLDEILAGQKEAKK
jgi:hypothetical protein